MPNPEQLSSFVEWYQRCITGDKKGQAQIFLDRLFQGFGLLRRVTLRSELDFVAAEFLVQAVTVI